MKTINKFNVFSISFLTLISSIGFSAQKNEDTIKKVENGRDISVLKANETTQDETDNDNILRVYNWEDYIEKNDETGESPLINEFEELYNCKVIYDTFDTNETMLSKLKLGVADYDLMCPSDYTIQRMIYDDLIIPFDSEKTPNYNAYVSPFLSGKLENIKVNNESNIVNKYARGYMWGTLGIMYNPNYQGFSDAIKESIHDDMNDWNSLWSDKYYGSFYLKDSMRDTYAVGIMHTYEKEFDTLKSDYEAGKITAKTYNDEVTRLFNLSDKETSDKVFSNLKDLTANGASFEIDEGKLDMQKGYIGIDVAWSGDASYALDLAEEENNLSLYYQVPKTGGNIWFDGWVMPKGANKNLAQKFVDFLSIPANAVRNMNYIGYTPFIAGDEMLETIKEWYDVSTDDTIDQTATFSRNLDYLFNGTLTKYTSEDCAMKISEEHRQFDAAYPSEEDLAHLAVMDDFGDNLSIIVSGWENFRGQEIPVYGYVIFGVCVLAIASWAVFKYIRTRKATKKRLERRKERLAKENFVTVNKNIS